MAPMSRGPYVLIKLRMTGFSKEAAAITKELKKMGWERKGRNSPRAGFSKTHMNPGGIISVMILLCLSAWSCARHPGRLREKQAPARSVHEGEPGITLRLVTRQPKASVLGLRGEKHVELDLQDR